VNRNLAMVSGPVACIAASTAVVGSVASRSAKLVLARPGNGASGQHHFHVGADHGADRAAITRAIGGEHQARRHRLEHVAQFGEVGADQRVRGRGRHIGHTGHQAAQRQQRVLQVVFGQDDHRPFGTQSPVDQPLRDGARAGPGFAVSHMAPVAGAAVGPLHAPRHEGALGRGIGPVLQAVGQARRMLFQGLLGLEIANAGRAVAHHHAGDAKCQGAEFRCGHGMGVSVAFVFARGCRAEHQAFWTLAARPSRKARTRLLASGALWAMADISASVMKPWSAGCSAMRGKACISE
jgi:hypothetical protein